MAEVCQKHCGLLKTEENVECKQTFRNTLYKNHLSSGNKL